MQAGAARFQYAPRFAAGVAVTSYDNGSAHTQVVATTGVLYTAWQVTPTPGSAWSSVTPFDGAGGPTAVADLHAARTEAEQVELFAADTVDRLWTRTMVSTAPGHSWYDWEAWSLTLYAPHAAEPPVIDNLATLTASPW